jgi:hypothetical protein
VAVLIAGIVVLAGAVVAVVLVTMSSQSTLFPTGSGTGNVTWNGSGYYNEPVRVGGTLQGLAISATAIPEEGRGTRGSITGTIGGKSFTGSLSGFKGSDPGQSVVGTYAGMPLTGTALTDVSNGRFVVTVSGMIEGQPVAGTLTGSSPYGSRSFTFTGTIGNLKVSGTAATVENGFTSTQEVG